MKITAVITTWQVPFDQVVIAQSQFTTIKAATDFINQLSTKWWRENEGSRSLRECGGDAYVPITELGYDVARYELWGGESGFHAMIDIESAALLHEAHYVREFDVKGLERPGYLINAYVAGHKPGGMTNAEKAKFEKAQSKGIAALHAYFEARGKLN